MQPIVRFGSRQEFLPKLASKVFLELPSSVSLADGSYWEYRYDRLGQVISGKKHWPDGTPVAGQQFEYAFDEIGNRTRTKAGGDSQGRTSALRQANYRVNFLNQYSQRDVPGTNDLIGLVLTATVSINSDSSVAGVSSLH